MHARRHAGRDVHEESRLGQRERAQAGQASGATTGSHDAPLRSVVTDPAPRAVLFDFGGVIWNMRWDVAGRLEAAHRLPAEALRATLYQSAAWREVERGRGDREAWLAAAHADLE